MSRPGRRFRWGSTIILQAVLFGATLRPAETVTSTHATFESALDQAKRPVDWLELGADLRLRDEYFDNAFLGLNPEVYNQLRMRLRLSTAVQPVDWLELGARLTWETRYFSEPDEPVPAYTPVNVAPTADLDEMILDQLTLRLTNLFRSTLSLTAGRQDILLGEGWLVADGTPLDDSRTRFFDAVRVVFDVPGWNTSFQALYVNQAAATTRWLHPINAQDWRHDLTEQNEEGGVFYLSNRSLEDVVIEGYFVYRRDERVLISGQDAEFFVPGLRLVSDWKEHWNFRAEMAPQWGERNDVSLAAFGINTLAAYSVRDPLGNRLRVGYEYLSGDKPETPDRDERFDSLWGRWARWSELLFYNFTTGPRLGGWGNWGNYHRIHGGWTIEPHPNVTCHADYHYLLSDRDEWPPLGAEGNRRGQLITALVEWRPYRRVATHLRGEVFWPGDYYDDSLLSQDTAYYLRGEVQWTW
jgi:hypothetical protein